MFKEIIFFVCALAACHADAPAPTKGVVCGRMPKNILGCLGDPKLLNEPLIANCGKDDRCENMKCIFTESGWMNGDKIDKKKVSDYYDTLASANPEWTGAVAHVKTSCLGANDLPAQGIMTNCPEADILYCAAATFIKNASPSQWSTEERCDKAREYAGACPFCPDECFADEVPKGSCQACNSPAA